MITTYRIISIAFAVAIIASATSAAERDICNRDLLTIYASNCVAATSPQTDYEKEGLKHVIKGRFCGKDTLVKDGLFRCISQDLDGISLLTFCSSAAAMEAARRAIPENDPRKHVDCRSNL